MCPCPSASCKSQGSLEHVMPHLMSVHKREDIVFLATDIKLPGAVDWVMMQSSFGHHFMLVLEKQEKLELNGPRRRLTWEATPRSIHKGIQSAIMNSDYLVITWSWKLYEAVSIRVLRDSGCSATLLHTDKTEHEDTCEFRPYMCPCPSASCKWQGSLEQVMPHLMSVHKSITTLQGEDIVFLATDIKLPGAVDWVMIQSCFSHHFILVLGKQEKFDGHQQFFAIVQLIGFRKQAENFAYSSFSLHRAPPSSTREARVRKVSPEMPVFPQSALLPAFTTIVNCLVLVYLGFIIRFLGIF
ncbi:E3 ubiquitin-protein ligase Siah1-like [Scylla paramamosain]|uniref:E3 ubiquitin-protein ligase Siah1-like n=1 Tax=Scylla paramamosain TaxID=85552 RepID=UPI003082D116